MTERGEMVVNPRIHDKVVCMLCGTECVPAKNSGDRSTQRYKLSGTSMWWLFVSAFELEPEMES